jgi:hypothetical protein
MKRLLWSATLSALIASAGTAGAHDNATLDAKPTPHNGQMRMAGPYHLELVPAARELVVYVTDHAGTKVPTKGMTGTAIVSLGDTRTSVPLRPAKDNVVMGSGQFSLPPEATVAVSISLPGQRPEKALFTPFRK